MTFPRALCLLVFVLLPAAPQDLPPGVLLVSRLKARLREQTARLPEYTCLETIERSHRSGSKAQMKPLDTVRLEVLYTGKREFYASSGDRSFQDRPPVDFVGSGLISDGIFASSLVNLFVHDNGLFTYRGDDAVAGRRAVKWDYRVPLLSSGYVLSVPGASAHVSEKGSFWADPDSLDLIRLEIQADEIPPLLQVENAETVIDYARMQIGEASILLPQTAVVRLLRFGGESRDQFEFTHCRSYLAQSTLSFDALIPVPVEGSTAPVTTPAVAPRPIPAGLVVTLALTRVIDENAAVGELIEAKASGAVSQKAKVIIPDGATVRGRIRRMEHYSDAGGYFIVGLEFDSIDTGGAESRFYAELQSADGLPGLDWTLAAGGEVQSSAGPITGQYTGMTTQIYTHALPGVGTFFMRGNRFRLPQGFKLIWKTRALE